MHMADALVSPVVAGTMYACSAVAAGYSLKKIQREDINHKIPVMGVLGAFVFATQMINFTIPGTGSSGHLTGGMMLSAILGPEAGFLTMIAILLIQCLMFADGGILAMGCNVWNMGFYGCFVGGYLIWNAFMRGGITKSRIVWASLLGCVLSLLLGAFSVTLETLASGITELPFTTFVSFMLPIHLVIGLVEGVITASVLLFILNTRPSLLQGYEASGNQRKMMGVMKVSAILGACALVIAGLFSWFASSNPDGLEWSLEKVTGSTELEAEGSLHQWAESAQENMALLPDYGFSGSESNLGTTVSGVLGAALVLLLSVAICLLIKRVKHEPHQ
ncbi:MAG: energy-coupling factor ABC transporter permease [Bacteroidaceae bacterium]|nr:energy-coupling factor ABC transporter permease [Bacteroidaceae bacterium]